MLAAIRDSQTVISIVAIAAAAHVAMPTLTATTFAAALVNAFPTGGPTLITAGTMAAALAPLGYTFAAVSDAVYHSFQPACYEFVEAIVPPYNVGGIQPSSLATQVARACKVQNYRLSLVAVAMTRPPTSFFAPAVAREALSAEFGRLPEALVLSFRQANPAALALESSVYRALRVW